jgi:ribonuclease BN (tRNA processing enzyme)
MARTKSYTAPDGTTWGVSVLTPGASNAMIHFRHPDGRTSRLDRYNWIINRGPEARSVTARLDANRVLDQLDAGRVIEPSVLVGAPRRGRRIIVTGDTRPCAATVEAARGADVLVHEATFGDEEAARAVETGHSTAREAAIVARDAGVGTLLLTHLSARYSRDASELGREARECFERTLVGKDGLLVEVPYRE